MSHQPFKYPQPTEAELDEPVLHWLSFNPFWWKILQGRVDEIATPAHWEDYTEEIDQVIQKMMKPHDPPVAAFIGGKVYLSADQNIPSATSTTVTLNASKYLGSVTFGSNALTIQEAGYYSIKAQVGYDTGGGYRGGEIRVNGVTEGRGAYGQGGIAQAAVSNYVPIVWEGALAINDVVTLIATHQSTGAINVRGGDTRTWLALHRISG